MIVLLKFIFRMVGLILVATAVVSGISDASISIARSKVSFQAVGPFLNSLFPATIPGLLEMLEKSVPPVVWDPVVQTLLTCPVWAVLAPFGLICLWLGARHQRPEPLFA